MESQRRDVLDKWENGRDLKSGTILVSRHLYPASCTPFELWAGRRPSSAHRPMRTTARTSKVMCSFAMCLYPCLVILFSCAQRSGKVRVQGAPHWKWFAKRMDGMDGCGNVFNHNGVYMSCFSSRVSSKQRRTMENCTFPKNGNRIGV